MEQVQNLAQHRDSLCRSSQSCKHLHEFAREVPACCGSVEQRYKIGSLQEHDMLHRNVHPNAPRQEHVPGKRTFCTDHHPQVLLMKLYDEIQSHNVNQEYRFDSHLVG